MTMFDNYKSPIEVAVSDIAQKIAEETDKKSI